MDEKGNRPPEVRLGKITSSGRVRIEFTNSMSFPSKEEFIELNKKLGNKLLDLVMMKGEEEEEDENLRSWQIISVDPKLIEVDLEFEKPIYVSQGEVADKLIV